MAGAGVHAAPLHTKASAATTLLAVFISPLQLALHWLYFSTRCTSDVSLSDRSRYRPLLGSSGCCVCQKLVLLDERRGVLGWRRIAPVLTTAATEMVSWSALKQNCDGTRTT